MNDYIVFIGGFVGIVSGWEKTVSSHVFLVSERRCAKLLGLHFLSYFLIIGSALESQLLLAHRSRWLFFFFLLVVEAGELVVKCDDFKIFEIFLGLALESIVDKLILLIPT